MNAKWRYWALVVILVLLNYIIFSTALTLLFRQQPPQARGTRTPQPTFTHIAPTIAAWVIAPTSTPWSAASPAPPAASPTAPAAPAPSASPVPSQTPTPSATPTPEPPTAAPTAETVIHTVKRGETLSEIAKAYGVPMQAIVEANGLENPNKIVTGQELIIPASGESQPPAAPTATTRPRSPTATPKPKRPTATPRPPTATPTKKANVQQFTGQVIWDPLVAPNCSGPAISKQSIIRDAAGNPVNGVRVEVNCYDNRWLSHPSGNPGEYEPGHYDFSFGQTTPQDWTCTARVFDLNGQPVASSQVLTIHFDTNDCRPEGVGHQVAIVNWTKNW